MKKRILLVITLGLSFAPSAFAASGYKVEDYVAAPPATELGVMKNPPVQALACARGENKQVPGDRRNLPAHPTVAGSGGEKSGAAI